MKLRKAAGGGEKGTCLYDMLTNKLIGAVPGKEAVHTYFDDSMQKLVMLFRSPLKINMIEVYIMKRMVPAEAAAKNNAAKAI